MYRELTIPKFGFSEWKSWHKRTELPKTDRSGIYAIAVGPENLHGKPFDWVNVVYIGMSNNARGLKERFKQFDRVLTGKDTKHSGARALVSDPENAQYLAERLYVSVFTPELFEEPTVYQHLMTFGLVAYLEYAAFAEYFHVTRNIRPKYNKK